MQQNRATVRDIVLGFNGTGKTTFLKNYVVNPAIKRGERVLIITPDDIEWSNYPLVDIYNKQTLNSFTGVKRHIFMNKFDLDYLSAFTKGIAIFDDCRSYLHAATDQSLHKMLIRSRQRMVDLYSVGHGFTEVPPKFFTFATNIILFQTKDNIYKRRDVLRDFDKMKRKQEQVNKKAENNIHHYEIIPQ